MTSCPTHWWPKIVKWRPCWCPRPIRWELNLFLMQIFSFVQWISKAAGHVISQAQWKRSILTRNSVLSISTMRISLIQLKNVLYNSEWLKLLQLKLKIVSIVLFYLLVKNVHCIHKPDAVDSQLIAIDLTILSHSKKVRSSKQNYIFPINLSLSYKLQ